MTTIDLYKAVPAFTPEKKLPSVYGKNELLQILSNIDCNCLSGRRDYAIMLMLAMYGLRAKDFVELKTENIDFQHCCISFKQSKTGNLYQAELLPAVQKALEIYLYEVNPSFENTVPFLSTYLGHKNVMETDRYLRFSYELYSEAHEKISEYTEGLFPEVDA